MAFRFSRLSEISVQHICCVIYGVPNVGKTSLALTASNPALLDFDSGAHRAVHPSDTPRIAQARTWADLEGLDAGALEGVDTLIVDTGGAAVNALIADIIRRDPKLGSNGAPSLQGWGQLKSRFRMWVNNIRAFGVDVVLICHMNEEQRGDTVAERVDVAGSSRNEIYQRADIMGRMRFVTGEDGRTVRQLSFAPSPGAYTKNVGLPEYEVPPPADAPDFLARVIADAKEKMNARSAAANADAQADAEWAEKLLALDTATEFNRAIAEAREADIPGRHRIALVKAGRARGHEWNAKEKLFTVPEGEDLEDEGGEESF